MKTQVKTKPKKMTVECLSCHEDVYIGRKLKVGNFLTCDNCYTKLVIINMEPLLVDWPDYKDDLVDPYGYYGEEEGPYDDVDDSDEIYGDY